MVVWLALALTPIVLVADYVFGVTGTPSFLLSAGALAPLAFVIGEATENVAEHTGAGIGGFLNASFGNAPELIISLFAVRRGLPNVVRGSLTGSIVSTALLVLGGAMIAGGEGPLDRCARVGDPRALARRFLALYACVVVAFGLAGDR